MKKVLIKICRLLGYELVDQSTLEFPVSNFKSSTQISVPGKKSISLGIGETNRYESCNERKKIIYLLASFIANSILS